MSSNAIRAQIESRTRDAFGKAVWPHLFRDCAVTELVDSAPDEIGLAPDLIRGSRR
jgi:integrase/recombinase XerD